MWTGFSCLRTGLVGGGFFEHRDKPSGSRQEISWLAEQLSAADSHFVLQSRVKPVALPRTV